MVKLMLRWNEAVSDDTLTPWRLISEVFTSLCGEYLIRPQRKKYFEKVHCSSWEFVTSGDEILSVNGVEMTGKTHAEALQMFRKNARVDVTLCIRRNIPNSPRQTKIHDMAAEAFIDHKLT